MFHKIAFYPTITALCTPSIKLAFLLLVQHTIRIVI